MTDIYQLRGITHIGGLKQRRCKSACNAQFVNKVFGSSDVRNKPCRNWCEAQKPEIEKPPTATYFNTQLGIDPNPANAPVFARDLKDLRSLGNSQNSNTTTNTLVQKAVTVGNNLVLKNQTQPQTTVSTEIIQKNNPTTPTTETNDKRKKVLIVAGGGLGLAALIGIAIAVSNNN